VLSSTHCLVLFLKERFRNPSRLAPLGLLFVFVTFHGLDAKYEESNCVLSEGYSLNKAAEYLDEIGYDIQFLNTAGYKLSGRCEFGFEYMSKEMRRLVIVDSDGRARLND